MTGFIRYISILILFSTSAIAQNQKPNIVFILTDDLGYGDIAALNEQGKIKTPNINRIAKAGVTFTDAHSSSAVCTPSRYGILTGRYNWRSTLKSGVLGFYGKPIIPTSRTTMASMLREKGYQTACIGKWHLGLNWTTKDGQKPVDNGKANNLDYAQKLTGGPTDLGFDYYFGVDAPNYPPYAFIQNNEILGNPNEYYTFDKELDSRPGTGVKDWKQVDVLPVLNKKTTDFIAEASKNNKPFFLYLPFTGPHTPVVPTTEFLGKSGINIYADFVMQMDAYVGDILDVLEKNHVSDNTIVVFTSDNGCSPHANFPELAEKGHDPSYIFRGTKADIFEGGHRIPCIVQWPNGIKAGQKVAQTISLVDFMATFANLTDYQLKNNEGEDSYDLTPLFKKASYRKTIREATVHHSINGSFSIRKGKWKLELCPGSGGWSDPRPGSDAENSLPSIQLYDLEKDIAEENNVQASNPKVVAELTALLTKYVNNGRSTPGPKQDNEGNFLPARMEWMSGK